MDFLTSNSPWVYVIIFFGKIVEVTLATLRIVLINRGERTMGSIVAFFEVTAWIFITGTVLAGFIENPLKAVVFAIAFAIGNFAGSWLENKIALGLSTIEVITTEDSAELKNALRAQNIALTSMHVEGKDGSRELLKIHIKRVRTKQVLKLINEYLPTSVVTVSDVRVLKGGYIRK